MIRIALILIALCSETIFAASFDCRQAKSDIEKAICDNPQLSQLDEKLATEYKFARSKLSSAANHSLINSQRSWLSFISRYCFVNMDASSVALDDATKCLQSAYQDRIKDLETTGKLVGGFKTYTVIDHHIRISKAQQNVYIIERKFTQIDDETPFGNRLNNYLNFKEKAELPTDRGTESYETILTQIAPDWLYKQAFNEIFTGAYPTSGTECRLYSISKERPLKISDIFQSHHWQKIFETVTKKHFLELAKNEKDFDITMVNDFSPMAMQPSSPFSYCFSKQGIEIYGFLPHVIRAFDGVTIDWRSLESVLTPYAYEQLKKIGAL